MLPVLRRRRRPAGQSATVTVTTEKPKSAYGIELEAVGFRFEPYRWRPCGVTWDSSRTVVVIKLRRTSALRRHQQNIIAFHAPECLCQDDGPAPLGTRGGQEV